MNTLDIVLLALLLFGAFKGYQKGFLLEAVAILSFLLGIIGGFKLLHWGMSVLDERFDINGELLPYLSFILIFISIVILVNLLGKVVKRIVDMTLLGSVDNLAGALLAVFKWAFGISVVFWLSNSFGLNMPSSWTEGSFLYSYLLTFAPQMVEVISGVLPFADDLFQKIRELLQGDPNS